MSIKSKIRDWLGVQPQQTKPKALTSDWTSSTGKTGGQKWKHGLSNTGAPTIISPHETLQNIRKQSHESPQARGMMTRPRDLTVDTGLKLIPIPAWKILGITDKVLMKEWPEEHAERYDMYMESKQCHRSGTMTGKQIERLWSYFDNRDNDQFARLYYSRESSLVSPVQIELIDPTQIRGYAYVDSEGWQDWRDGIKRDSKGEEIAYKIRIKKKSQGGFIWENVEIPARGARSGRVFMFHGFEQEYAGQGRGFPKLHFGIQDLENIVDYISANIKKAINQGDIVGFIEPSENADASNPMGGGQGAIPVRVETQIIDGQEEFVAVRDEYATKTPGSDFFANLKAGESMKFLPDTAPGPQFDDTITTITKYISAARGWPLEVILAAFNSNYSASRAALLEAHRTGRIAQADIKADLRTPWYLMWLSEEIASGRTSAPGWNDPRLKQAWSRFILQGPALPSISPRDDVAAFETELKLSLNTQEKIARQRNGTDAEQNIIENTEMFSKTPPVPWEDKPDDGETKPGESSSDND